MFRTCVHGTTANDSNDVQLLTCRVSDGNFVLCELSFILPIDSYSANIVNGVLKNVFIFFRRIANKQIVQMERDNLA